MVRKKLLCFTRKMKKFLVAIVAFLYMSTAIGATVHLHYCMGKLANWGLGHQDSKHCGKCGMVQTGKGCCKDENKFFKNTADQKTIESIVPLIQLSSIVLPTAFFEIAHVRLCSSAQEHPASHAPPRNHGELIYIYCCDYRI